VKYRMIEDKEGVYYQMVLDKTTFYPEGGDQVGDIGRLNFGNEEVEVLNVVKENDLPIHITKSLPYAFASCVTISSDLERRRRIENNHTVTHLLHAVLREVLVKHSQQLRSLVSDQNVRFDFSNFTRMSVEESSQVESFVSK